VPERKGTSYTLPAIGPRCREALRRSEKEADGGRPARHARCQYSTTPTTRRTSHRGAAAV